MGAQSKNKPEESSAAVITDEVFPSAAPALVFPILPQDVPTLHHHSPVLLGVSLGLVGGQVLLQVGLLVEPLAALVAHEWTLASVDELVLVKVALWAANNNGLFSGYLTSNTSISNEATENLSFQ